MIPNGDPLDGFLVYTLTLVKYSYKPLNHSLFNYERNNQCTRFRDFFASVSSECSLTYKGRDDKVLNVKLGIFSFPFVITYVLDTQKNHHIEMVLLCI